VLLRAVDFVKMYPGSQKEFGIRATFSTPILTRVAPTRWVLSICFPVKFHWSKVLHSKKVGKELTYLNTPFDEWRVLVSLRQNLLWLHSTLGRGYSFVHHRLDLLPPVSILKISVVLSFKCFIFDFQK
jgi:hypothetical protein